jgi:hypothetical protein
MQMRIRRHRQWLTIILVFTAGGAGGYWLGQRGAGPHESRAGRRLAEANESRARKSGIRDVGADEPSANKERPAPVQMSAAFRERRGPVRWSRTMDAIESMTEENCREMLLAFDEVTATSGGEFWTERIIALIRAGELGGKTIVDELVEKDRAAGKGFGTSSQAFEGWVSSDPAAAWEWMRQTSDESLRRACLPRFVWGMSATDPEKQFDYFKQLSDTDKSLVATDASRALIQTGGFAAVDQLLNAEIAASAEGGNSSALRTIFDVIARQRRHAVQCGADPDEACRWLAGYAGNSFVATDQFRQMAAQLASGRGPDAAANWMASVYATESSNVMAPALSATIQQWAGNDPNAAGQWLRTQRQHPGYSTMATAFAAAIEAEDTEAAAAWRKTAQ